MKQEEGTLGDLIKRATDEKLTADNWQYILEVCDFISSNPETGTKDAIKHVSQCLSSKDANQLLRTLSLTIAIAENCGSRMKQEIATTSFLQGSLLKRLGDRNLHKTVKFRIAEVIAQLYKSFKDDPSLKPMSDAYKQLKKDYPQYLVKNAPGKPEKREITESDKQKEDDELQRVLKLSLHEYEREKVIKSDHFSSNTFEDDKSEIHKNSDIDTKNNNVTGSPSKPKNQTASVNSIATVPKVRALYDLISYEPDELSFRKGDVITVIESVYRDWWRGSLPNGKIGIFPLNYVTPVVAKSEKDLAAEADTESKLLNVYQKKVDTLLAILSSNNPTLNEDEVASLYNEIIPLRPTLAKFIDKYNVRKEELMVLNSNLNTEYKQYNELIDIQVAQNARTQYTGASMTPYPTTDGNLPYQNSSFESQRYGQTGYHNMNDDRSSFEQPRDNDYTIPQYRNSFSSNNAHDYQHQGYNPNFRRTSTNQNGSYSNVNRFPEIDDL